MSDGHSSSTSRSPDAEISSTALDDIYADQLKRLRLQIRELAQAHDMDLLGKWLKIFSRAPNSEKIARNCLANLMQNQLHYDRCLSAPFTDQANCTRHLEKVLCELENKCTARGSLSGKCDAAHCQQLKGLDSSRLSLEGLVGVQCQGECRHKILQAENGFLRRELEVMRLKLLKKDVDKYELQEQVENARQEALNFEINYLAALNKTLDDYRKEYLPEKFFENLFKDLAEDGEFLSAVRKLDKDFAESLSKLVEIKLEEGKPMIESYVMGTYRTSVQKLKEKYAHRLKVQKWALGFQNKMLKLKCFSKLRSIVINTKVKDENVSRLLKSLDDEYQKVFNGSF